MQRPDATYHAALAPLLISDVTRAIQDALHRDAVRLVRVLGRLDTMLFVITAVVVLDTIGASPSAAPRPSRGWP